MKKYILILVSFIFFACGNETTLNNCFNNSIGTITLSLDSPQLNPILTPGNSVIINGGIKGIVLTNKGTSSGSFSNISAIDLACPDRNCDTPMTVSYPTLQCPCNETKYSLLDGSLQSGESDCNSARVYNVNQSGNSIIISD